jgi:hypothetical protein
MEGSTRRPEALVLHVTDEGSGFPATPRVLLSRGFHLSARRLARCQRVKADGMSSSSRAGSGGALRGSSSSPSQRFQGSASPRITASTLRHEPRSPRRSGMSPFSHRRPRFPATCSSQIAATAGCCWSTAQSTSSGGTRRPGRLLRCRSASTTTRSSGPLATGSSPTRKTSTRFRSSRSPPDASRGATDT